MYKKNGKYSEAVKDLPEHLPDVLYNRLSTIRRQAYEIADPKTEMPVKHHAPLVIAPQADSGCGCTGAPQVVVGATVPATPFPTSTIGF